jgi:hypothetical protein
MVGFRDWLRRATGCAVERGRLIALPGSARAWTRVTGSNVEYGRTSSSSGRTRYTGWGSHVSLGSAPSSWVREVIASLVNTLCRWYSTVRGLMKSCAPISGFE